MDESWRLAKKRETLNRRAVMIQAIRRFFLDRNYLEIETPIRTPAPAPEEYIDAVASGDWFLQTSPELYMKRLLAAGYPNLFQISKCFRDAERGHLHLPEFTMLEWYRRGCGYRALMQECEDLILYVMQVFDINDVFLYQGRTVSLKTPWERISVSEAFTRYAPLSIKEALSGNCFDDMMTERVEPHLGTDHPVFLYDYPVARAALARVKPSDHTVAERFELYMGGLELANAFSELTDEKEQRQRFDESRRDRRTAGKTVYPLPDAFLESLQNMPETAGIALGVDRLAMLLTDAASIDDVVAFTPETA